LIGNSVTLHFVDD